LIAALPLAALLYDGAARAEVRIAGGTEIVHVDARDASLEEVLSALRTRFGLQYRGPPLTDRRITGAYEGTLRQVVRRLLEGYDFVLKTQSDTLEVVVVGGAAGEARATPRAAGPRLRRE